MSQCASRARTKWRRKGVRFGSRGFGKKVVSTTTGSRARPERRRWLGRRCPAPDRRGRSSPRRRARADGRAIMRRAPRRARRGARSARPSRGCRTAECTLRARRRAQRGAQGGVLGSERELARQRGFVAARKEAAVDAGAHDLGIAADIARHGRQTRGHGFEQRVGHALAERGQHEHVEGLQQAVDVLAMADQLHLRPRCPALPASSSSAARSPPSPASTTCPLRAARPEAAKARSSKA